MEFSKIEIFRKEASNNESKAEEIKYILPLSADFPRFRELDKMYDGKSHENVILIPESINEGLAVAGRILNCCLGDGKASGGSSCEVDCIDDIFDENNEESDNTVEMNQPSESVLDDNAFLIYKESEISKECNDCGESDQRKSVSDVPQYVIAGCGRLIIVCDGIFSLSDKLMSQLKRTTGGIIVIIPKSKVNVEKVNDLIFEKGFECFEVPARTKQYYAELLAQYLHSLGFKCLADTSIIISNFMEFRNNQFREYDIKILCDKAIERAGTSKTLENPHFRIDGYKQDKTSGEEMLNKIIGLEKVKELIKIECAKTLHNKRMTELTSTFDNTYKSLCFKGPSGTGKTSMARAVSKIYAENGVTNGVFIEVSRAELIGRYVGETSQKSRKIFDQADGGVLFIDEAGSIATNDRDSFGVEALASIVRYMDNNLQTVVIFATYDDEMEKLFEINQGLKSRISSIISFESYSTEQLVSIFRLMTKGKGYSVAPGYKKIIEAYFDKIRAMDSFGNGRDVRKLLEAAIGIMAVQSKSFSTAIPLSAIRQAVAKSLENQPVYANRIGF